MSDHPDLLKQRGSRRGRLAPDAREALLTDLRALREHVGRVGPEEPSPALSQGWVDRRRLLLVDLVLTLCEEVLREETLGARELAERLHPVLVTAQELAPGYCLGKAAEQVLLGLEEGEPGLEVD